MSIRLSCPYCNASMSLPAVPASGRAPCPRCGETVPIRVAVEQNGLDEPVEESTGATTASSMSSSSRGPSLAPVIGFGLVMVAIAVAVGIYFVSSRSLQNEVVSPPRPSHATHPPGSVPGLAYLPSDTGIAFAVQPGPFLMYAVRDGADPRKRLLEAGLPEGFFAVLDRLGLTLEQIHHVAGGLVVTQESPLPRVVLVLRLNQPHGDESEFLRRLKATQYTTPDGETRYKGIDLGLPLPIELARLDATTYVFASDPKDLENLEDFTGRGSTHLTTGIRESMARLSPAAVAWMASDFASWEDKSIVKLLARGTWQPEIRKRLHGVRAVAAGLSLEPDPVWTAAVRGADTAAVERLEAEAQDAIDDSRAATAVHVDELWVVVKGPGSMGWLRNLLPESSK